MSDADRSPARNGAPPSTGSPRGYVFTSLLAGVIAGAVCGATHVLYLRSTRNAVACELESALGLERARTDDLRRENERLGAELRSLQSHHENLGQEHQALRERTERLLDVLRAGVEEPSQIHLQDHLTLGMNYCDWSGRYGSPESQKTLERLRVGNIVVRRQRGDDGIVVMRARNDGHLQRDSRTRVFLCRFFDDVLRACFGKLLQQEIGKSVPDRNEQAARVVQRRRDALVRVANERLVADELMELLRLAFSADGPQASTRSSGANDDNHRCFQMRTAP